MAKNFVSNKDETVRMFDNNFMEALSRVHPSVPLIIYVPVIFYLIYLSFAQHSFSITRVSLLFIGGIFAWTFVEYVLHKYVFHFDAKSDFGKN